MYQKKCRQPELPAPLYEFASVIEFQRQLYVPHRLGAGDLTHTSVARNRIWGYAQTHVWSIVLYVVKEIDEVGTELQPESLRNRKILMQTQVNVGVMGRAET